MGGVFFWEGRGCLIPQENRLNPPQLRTSGYIPWSVEFDRFSGYWALKGQTDRHQATLYYRLQFLVTKQPYNSKCPYVCINYHPVYNLLSQSVCWSRYQRNLVIYKGLRFPFLLSLFLQIFSIFLYEQCLSDIYLNFLSIC